MNLFTVFSVIDDSTIVLFAVQVLLLVAYGFLIRFTIPLVVGELQRFRKHKTVHARGYQFKGRSAVLARGSLLPLGAVVTASGPLLIIALLKGCYRMRNMAVMSIKQYVFPFLWAGIILSAGCTHSLRCLPNNNFSVVKIHSVRLFENLNITRQTRYQMDSISAYYEEMAISQQNAIRKIKQQMDAAQGHEREKLRRQMNEMMRTYEINLEEWFGREKNGRKCSVLREKDPLKKRLEKTIADTIRARLDKVRKERGYDFIIDISDTTLAAWDAARYDFRKMNCRRQRKKLFELGICDFSSQDDITDSLITVMNAD